jgi:hypothetical protein
LNDVPLEDLQKQAALQAERDEKDFLSLEMGLGEGKCHYCGHTLTHFSINKPCLHWLLWRAPGLRKKHFQTLFENVSYHQLDAYLRWVANTEVPLQNINDLATEKSSNKFIETTIRYRNLEWSFSCSYEDFAGHAGGFAGKEPHYHFQMKKDGNVVINFNGFHILFQDYDEFAFAVERGEFDRLKSGHLHGAGTQSMFDNFSPAEIIDSMRSTDNENEAQFNVQVLIEADQGTTISGDSLVALLEESKRTDVSMAKLAQKLKNSKTKVIIQPGKGVPAISRRDKNRARGSK